MNSRRGMRAYVGRRRESNEVRQTSVPPRFCLDSGATYRENKADGAYMKRIVRLMAVMAAVLLGFLWYAHWSRSRAMNSGEVRETQSHVRVILSEGLRVESRIGIYLKMGAAPANRAAVSVSGGECLARG